MNKNKFLLILVIALVVSNIALLYLHFNRRPMPERPPRPRQIIIEKLHFDEGQIKRYEVLIEEHQKKTMDNEAQINEIRDLLYLTLKDNDNSKTDSLTTSIAQLQKKVEISNYEHFKDIKALCKLEQEPYFESLVGELSDLFKKKRRLPK